MIRTESLEDGAVTRIVLDAPKANILDAAMIAGVSRAFDERVTKDTKLVIFQGAGRHFSFGASVEEHQKEQAATMLSAFHGLFRKMAEVAVPTCALIDGQCLGGGLELAAWCTLIVATPVARLGQPEIQLGVIAPMASVLLPWRAGGRAALDLCVTGRTISAQEAMRLGIVDAVVEDPEAWWRQHYAEYLKERSASSLRFAERAVRMDLMRRLQTDLPAIETLYLEELMATHDANEGIDAFIKRRKATFKNA